MKAVKRFVVAALLLSPLLIAFTARSQSQTPPAQAQPPVDDAKAKGSPKRASL